ncbi:MAG: hypothetical protein A2W91_12945 [Bacteroidetes bacterium GWF2_38_335]|nr:MAG: hypothetical protein A2W91_12945 [Bacteroidetes bacterium GWF2_38_335]HBS86931.1 hypothetical protein [Bacteroidales bacterium]
MKKLILIMSFILILNNLFSQDEKITFSKSIYVDRRTDVAVVSNDFQVGKGYSQSLKYFGQNIKPYLSKYDDSNKDFLKFRNSRITSFSAQCVLFPTFFIYCYSVASSEKEVWVDNTLRTKIDFFKGYQVSLLSASVTTVIMWIIYESRARKFIKSSVEKYNNSISNSSSNLLKSFVPDDYRFSLNSVNQGYCLGFTLKWDMN